MDDLVAKVEDLAELLEEHKLTAIKLREGGVSIELRKDLPATHQAVVHAGHPSADGGPREGAIIPSPTVGVFYSRPSPADEPFVQPGDPVSIGQVIGVIEAMKVFNDIESPVAGTIAKRLVEDGQVVQHGDALFLLEA